jgi:hypothetical protein
MNHSRLAEIADQVPSTSADPAQSEVVVPIETERRGAGSRSRPSSSSAGLSMPSVMSRRSANSKSGGLHRNCVTRAAHASRGGLRGRADACFATTSPSTKVDVITSCR